MGFQVFDIQGQYLWMLTSSLDALTEPKGLAILPSEELIAVVDTGNYRIKAFNLLHRAENTEPQIKESPSTNFSWKHPDQNDLDNDMMP
ncbi:unnamed protein product [Rodentolepis nana]|uniref:PQQ_3 domain-containing protein n=1 Tax=Rodentolepis nana TaxID=102285 RepID=A0A0R3THC0_RODNA|nr:unnamed protein product [Rodentolepis nana]